MRKENGLMPRIIVYSVLLLFMIFAFANSGIRKLTLNNINVAMANYANAQKINIIPTVYNDDDAYKKALLMDSNISNYTMENLAPIMGPNEMREFIKDNDTNVQIYTPSDLNVKNKIFSANFHMHTTNSDGRATVKELLDEAQKYASGFPKDKYFYLAITDHNTVLGAKEVVDVLENNPNKYNKLKVVLGMEIYTAYKSEYSNKPIEIHVLSWCINPYDKFLNKEFEKKDLSDKWNRIGPDRDFDFVINLMSQYGLVGIAHPAKYIDHLGCQKYPYIGELLSRYLKDDKDVKFIEGYYQSYGTHDTEAQAKAFTDFCNYINKTAKEMGVIRTGSTDTHGKSIFSRY